MAAVVREVGRTKTARPGLVSLSLGQHAVWPDTTTHTARCDAGAVCSERAETLAADWPAWPACLPVERWACREPRCLKRVLNAFRAPPHSLLRAGTAIALAGVFAYSQVKRLTNPKGKVSASD